MRIKVMAARLRRGDVLSDGRRIANIEKANGEVAIWFGDGTVSYAKLARTFEIEKGNES